MKNIVSPYKENTLTSFRNETWKGSIPISLSLSPDSLSSATMPDPLYKLIPRMTYLHVGLADEIKRFYKFAPTLQFNFNTKNKISHSEDNNNSKVESEQNTDGEKNSTDNTETDNVDEKSNTNTKMNDTIEDLPVCWFEDEISGIALRWQLFTGVLYDLLKRKHVSSTPTNSTNSFPIPWKIRVHFTSYPSHILPLLQSDCNSTLSNRNSNNQSISSSSSALQSDTDSVFEVIQRFYFHSLKQALFLQYNSSKTSMNISKNSHLKLWDSIKRHQFQAFWDVSRDLIISSTTSSNNELVHIPIRLLLDGKPAIQRPCNYKSNCENNTTIHTLKQLFLDWIPFIFSSTSNDIEIEIEKKSYDETEINNYAWDIQGIQPPLSTPILNLWEALCYPDQFLYITVISTNL